MMPALPNTLRDAGAPLERLARLALHCLALGLAFERIEPLAHLGGAFAITTVEALLFLVLGLWGMARLIQRQAPRWPTGIALPAGLWVVALLAAALLAPTSSAPALRFALRLILGLLLGWATFDLAGTTKTRRSLIQAISVGGILVALFGLGEVAGIEAVVGWLRAFKHAPTRLGELIRLSGPLGYATIAAMLLEISLPLLVAWLVTARQRWLRALLGLGLVVTAAALLLTLTRSGVGALLIAFGGMAFLAHRQGQPALLRVTVGAALLLVLLVGPLLVANPLLRLRFGSESDRAWYTAAYTLPPTLAAEPGATLRLPVGVTNTGVRPWNHAGDYPFALTARLLHADGSPLVGGAPILLPADLPPGQRVTVTLHLTVPITPGRYLLEAEMIHQGITTFGDRGAPPARAPLVVGDAVPAAPMPPALPYVAAPGRLTLWRAALRMVATHPLLGVGPDNFRLTYGPAAGLPRWNTLIHTNNLYLEMLVNTGLVGAGLFVWLNVAIIRRALHALHRATPANHVWHIALLGSLAAWYLHGLFDYFLAFTPTLLLFWMVAAIALRNADAKTGGAPEDAPPVLLQPTELRADVSGWSPSH